MNFSTALPTFVITLREGVEAALVVGIVLALLKKLNNLDSTLGYMLVSALALS